MIDVIVAIFQLALIAYLALFGLLLVVCFCVVAPWVIGVALVNFFRGQKNLSVDDFADEVMPMFTGPTEIIFNVGTIANNHYSGEVYSRLDQDAQIYPFVLRGNRELV